MSAPASLLARPERLVLAVVLAAAGIRLGAALLFPGFATGDDVEIVESALASIGAIDYTPWPIRNQFLPHLLGLPVAAAARLGLVEPWLQAVLLRALFALIGGLTVWLTWRLGRELFDRRDVAVLGALLLAVHPLAIAFSATTLPRAASTAAVVAAAVLIHRHPNRLALPMSLAGLLLAFAFACRYSEVILLVALAATVAWNRPRPALAAMGWMAAGFGVGVVAMVGVDDWLTYGAPFHSLGEFARYTLIERQASARVAVQPVEWYARRLLFWIPASVVPAFFFLPRSSAAVRTLAATVAIPVLLLSLVHHKDLRYLHGVLPFVALLASAGFVDMRKRGGWARRAAAALIAISVLLGLYRADRTLADSSNAAVEAARILAAAPDLQSVGVTQLWAFGGAIHLGSKQRVVELGARPTVASLPPRVVHLDAVAVQHELVAAPPEVWAALAQSGFSEWRTVSARGADAVTIFRRR